MQDENVRLVGRVPVVPRSDPGGGYFVHVRGLRLLIKRPTSVRIRTWGGGVSLDFLITIVVRPRGSL